MVAVGDILRIYVPSLGKKKYHLCVCVGVGTAAHRFLFLNSEEYFDGTYVVDCTRVPCLPPSDTGKTVVSLNDIPRYNDRQLQTLQAHRMGGLAADVAAELIPFVRSAKVLNRADREMIVEALTLIANCA